MKTMKNVLMILLGAALVLSLAGVGAVAADTTTNTNGTWNEGNGEITVSYTIGESYSVTIPADVVIPELGTPYTGDFTVNSATMGSNSNLEVTVTSTYGWQMKRATDDNENVIPYTMSYKDTNGADASVTVDDDDNSVTIYSSGDSVTEEEAITNTLSFTVSADTTLPTMAGTYTDTLTFTVTHTPTSTT